MIILIDLQNMKKGGDWCHRPFFFGRNGGWKKGFAANPNGDLRPAQLEALLLELERIPGATDLHFDVDNWEIERTLGGWSFKEKKKRPVQAAFDVGDVEIGWHRGGQRWLYFLLN